MFDALLPNDGPSNPTPRSASMYHLCSNPVILKSPKFTKIEQILESHPPRSTYTDWPTDVPPPGLFLFVGSSNSKLAEWAMQQLHDTYKTTPMPAERFVPIYVETLQEIAERIEKSQQPVADEISTWATFTNTLRYVPPPFLTPSTSFAMDLRKMVLSHLPDVGTRKFSFM